MHGKSGRGNEELVSWATCLFEEFQNTQKSLVANPPVFLPIKEAWRPPLQGSLKLNTYTVVSQGRAVFGVGAIIMNANGEVILAFSKLVKGCFSVEVCEAIALREGLWLAKQHGLKIDCAEVDAANVAASVQCFKPSRR
ncbi:hypothetical protein LWI29_025011 [Acer saccharum]|uniref:RNase H type-1 domain-containing protein n=1 Tax=Acer saccharum TaxID=4024 RepID=A0AA39SUW5_ACESA|nr:hypothetical protein LWI29_025011 [Acer saccharum]